ncbi:MAG TPA: insulinase family protein [Candidatus Polarisedimenticolaceae bacterium]
MKRTKSLLLAAAIVLSALPAFAQAKVYTDIKYPTLPDFKVPQTESFTLKNGMRVWLMPDTELPLITVTARVRAGSYLEPADKIGLGSVLGQAQRSGGTASMPADTMDEFLAAKAANVETFVDDDVSGASMNCLKQDFDDVLKVFVDVLRNPAFPQDKIDLAKVQERTGIARRNDDINGIAGRELRKLVYGADSPLARTTEYATVAAITRDDVVAFHKKYWQPNNVLLGVVGDFDSKEMRKKIEAAFGAWPKGAEAPLPTPAYRKEANPGVFFVEKSDVTQATVGMAHLGIDRKNPDFFAVQVMNEVLGGGFSARMFSNIRSKKGLAYSVGGGLGAGFTAPGLFQAQMQTKSASVFDAVAALREEISGIITNPASDEELKRAKESILNSFVFNYDSRDKILGQQINNAYYGLPANYLETYRANIEKVTKEDVARVAKQYVKPDALTVMIAGKAADFGKPLSTLGKVTTLDITIPPPPDAAPKVAKTGATAAAGKQVLARAAAALGGKDATSVKAIRAKTKRTINFGGQKIQLGQTLLLAFPDRMHVTIQSPMGEQTIVVAEDASFMTSGGQVRDLPPPAVEKAKKDLAHDLRSIVRYAGDAEAVGAGKEDVDGVACDVVSVTLRGVESRLWVASDGKVLRQTYQGETPQGAPGAYDVRFSDYRDVGGRQVPHKQVVTIDGQEFATYDLESFEVDPVVDAAAFQKPAA